MTKKWFARFHRDERGVAAVEFALLVLPLFLLVFGVVDFGLGIWTYNNVKEATAQGARFAIVRGQGSLLGQAGPDNEGSAGSPIACSSLPVAGSEVVPIVCQFAFPLDQSKLTSYVDWDGANVVGQNVQVVTNYEYTPFLSELLHAPNFNLKASSVMFITCCD